MDLNALLLNTCLSFVIDYPSLNRVLWNDCSITFLQVLLISLLILGTQVKILKKASLAIILSTILLVSLTGVFALCANTDAVSPGPAPDSGDSIPSGNQFIQPEAPGMGPAPNSGSGDHDGSGF